jgi:septal ring factor EnvC (AmiA/AmiB activator)
MKKLVSSVLIAMLALTSFSVIGCKSKPNAEELQALEEAQNAALSAENTVAEKKREKSRLESQLNQKKRELQETQNELEAVKQRLAE